MHSIPILFDDVLGKLKVIAGKSFKIGFVRKSIFTSEWKQQEEKERARCHVQAALQFLNFLGDSKDSPVFQEKVSATIADLTPHVKTLDENLKLSSFLLSTNSLPSTIHYKHAEVLFYARNISKDDRTTYGLDLLVVNAMRLALEKRINGLIGVDILLDKNNVPVSLSKKLKLVSGLKHIYYDESVNWDEIRLVNDWMNHYIHRQLRPYPWAIHQAFQILNPILLPGKFKYDSKEVFSFYWSTIVTRESTYQQEIVAYLDKNFPNHSVHWDEKQEILIL